MERPGDGGLPLENRNSPRAPRRNEAMRLMTFRRIVYTFASVAVLLMAASAKWRPFF
jgi:hypothetical protein